MADPTAPTEWIAGCRASHAVLAARLEGLTDAQAREPSLLPGWSRGHLLTHLARNGDSVVRALDGAARGEVVDPYAGGVAGRAQAIEDGAWRPATALVADVVASSARVEQALTTFPSDAWGNRSRSVQGDEYPASFVAFRRWREVEVHLVDLGLGYTPTDWPQPMVAEWLGLELARLDERTDPGALLAWIIGRGPAPSLTAW
jgi:maleylpyruvate isomerase